MKKILQTLTRVFFAVLLLSFGTANAQTVHFDDAGDPNKATSITELTVNDISYDVTFIVGQVRKGAIWRRAKPFSIGKIIVTAF